MTDSIQVETAEIGSCLYVEIDWPDGGGTLTLPEARELHAKLGKLLAEIEENRG